MYCSGSACFLTFAKSTCVFSPFFLWKGAGLVSWIIFLAWWNFWISYFYDRKYRYIVKAKHYKLSKLGSWRCCKKFFLINLNRNSLRSSFRSWSVCIVEGAQTMWVFLFPSSNPLQFPPVSSLSEFPRTLPFFSSKPILLCLLHIRLVCLLWITFRGLTPNFFNHKPFVNEVTAALALSLFSWWQMWHFFSLFSFFFYLGHVVCAPVSHLLLVLLLLGDFGEQFGFLSGERLDQRVTLGHEAGFELHTALLKQNTQKEEK